MSIDPDEPRVWITGLDDEPISLMEWATLMEDIPRRTIAETEIKNAVGAPLYVVTRWTGMADPILDVKPWGTIVLTEQRRLVFVQWEYNTRKEAEEKHPLAVAELQNIFATAH